MEKIEIFELDDDFDPLEELEFEADADLEYAGGIEYQVPVIPDADRSIVPEPIELAPAERIDKLIRGLPGQKFRVLSGIRICSEPKTLDQAGSELEALYPQGASVYPSVRIIELLAEAGALEVLGDEGDHDEMEDATEDELEPRNGAFASLDIEQDSEERIESMSLEDFDIEYDEVEQSAPKMYLATAAGMLALEELWSSSAAKKLIADDPRYLPVYYKILKMCAEPGGKTKSEIAAQVDSDPLLQEPRRWCQHFLEKLREANALDWDDAWVITAIGNDLLESGLFAEHVEE